MTRSRLAGILIDRYSFTLFNLFIVYVLIASIIRMAPMLFNIINNIIELEGICDASATILIAYGVVLEERASLMKILGIPPKVLDDHIDHLCHDLGVELLVIGLLMEVVVQLIRIPNEIVNTDGIEWFIFLSGAIFAFLSSYLIIVNCFKLVRTRPA